MRGLAAILAVILAVQLTAVYAEPQACRITLFEDGWAYVTVLWAAHGGLIEEVPSLPGAEMILATDEEGLPLNATESNGFILVETFGAELINLSYVTQQITSKEGDVWTVNVSSNLGECEVWLPRGAVLVGMSEIPSAVTSHDNRTLVLIETPAWLSYVIPIPGTAGSQAGFGARIGLSAAQMVLLAAGILAVVALVLIFTLKAKKGKAQPPRPPLTYDDIAVLRKLILMGGEAYLSELRAALSMPKTTLWRRTRRLEEAGMISVEKTPQGSLIRITQAGRRVVT